MKYQEVLRTVIKKEASQSLWNRYWNARYSKNQPPEFIPLIDYGSGKVKNRQDTYRTGVFPLKILPKFDKYIKDLSNRGFSNKEISRQGARAIAHNRNYLSPQDFWQRLNEPIVKFK